MTENPESSENNDLIARNLIQDIFAVIKEPILVLDKKLNFVNSNDSFYSGFGLLDSKSTKSQSIEEQETYKNLLKCLDEELTPDKEIKNFECAILVQNIGIKNFLINANRLKGSGLIIFSFVEQKDSLENFDKIFAQAPAMVCVLQGPNHTFHKANENYFKIVGDRSILGKTVREALPELEGQGFFEMLDKVYNTGETFIGSEVPVDLAVDGDKIKSSYLDFVYQPIFDDSGQCSGIFVHAIDITEKVAANRKIEQSENELRDLIDTVPAIIWITVPSGENYYLNKKWYEFTGQSLEESENFGWLEAIHPDDRKSVEQKFLKSNTERTHFQASFRLRRKNGDYRWVLDSGSPNFSKEGDYEGMIGTVIDINEEKLKEELLREKEHRIHSIIEEADVATALYTGKEMKIDMANEAMIELWGKDSSVIGTTLHEALPELEGQPFHDLLQKVYHSGETYWGKEDPVDLMIDGELQTGYFNFTYKALKNENGEIYGILNMAINVSEIVLSKKLLKESEARYKQMADLMPEKVINLDAKGNVVYFNQGWLEYTGLTKEKFEDIGLLSFIHPSEKEEFKETFKYSLDTGSDFEMELRYLNKKGKYRWHLNRAEAIKDNFGNIQLWICTSTEIQKIKAEEKRKENFLKLVSHELKTPVTSIKGYVQLLLSLLKREKEVPLNSIPFEKSLERIDQQVVRLTRLISEMLDLSRIEKNKLVLQRENFSLNKLVQETIQDINFTNTEYKINIEEEYECNVFADRDRIGQVLINLVTNSIKYSPENHDIDVCIKKSGKNKVAVSVKDTGIGIDKVNQKKIFKRFYRIDFKNEDTYSGFGIGLYLANEIMKRHKGKISVQSEKGKGSVFTFVLDVAPTD